MNLNKIMSVDLFLEKRRKGKKEHFLKRIGEDIFLIMEEKETANNYSSQS